MGRSASGRPPKVPLDPAEVSGSTGSSLTANMVQQPTMEQRQEHLQKLPRDVFAQRRQRVGSNGAVGAARVGVAQGRKPNADSKVVHPDALNVSVAGNSFREKALKGRRRADGQAVAGGIRAQQQTTQQQSASMGWWSRTWHFIRSTNWRTDWRTESSWQRFFRYGAYTRMLLLSMIWVAVMARYPEHSYIGGYIRDRYVAMSGMAEAFERERALQQKEEVLRRAHEEEKRAVYSEMKAEAEKLRREGGSTGEVDPFGVVGSTVAGGEWRKQRSIWDNWRMKWQIVKDSMGGYT